MYRGVATFTLDYGKCPRWLFERMVKLGREMAGILIDDYGPDEFIKRIADPVWFQSLGTVLAFDWNASGLTTILTAALKESIRGRERELGIFICGGKGKTSRKTPDEIKKWGGDDKLVYNSKMTAKVDSSLIQDGFQIYHHSFFFSRNGAWTVVQQGMNTTNQTARRYHWYSDNISFGSAQGKKDLVCEPHAAISSESITDNVLNLVSKNSTKTRDVSTELAQGSYLAIKKDIELLRRHSSDLSQMIALRNKKNQERWSLLNLTDMEFSYHPVIHEDFAKSRYLEKILSRLTYEKPENYEKLLATEGVGPKTIRALSLVSEVIYGAAPSYEDPARYSFAHGGKDSTPYPVDRPTYDQTIEILKKAVKKTRFDVSEKNKILARISK